MLPRNLDPFFSLNITKSERYLEQRQTSMMIISKYYIKKDLIHVKISVIFFMLLYGYINSFMTEVLII